MSVGFCSAQSVSRDIDENWPTAAADCFLNRLPLNGSPRFRFVPRPLGEPFSNALFAPGVCSHADQGIKDFDLESQRRVRCFFYREDLELSRFHACHMREVSLDLLQKSVPTRYHGTRKLSANYLDSVSRTYQDFLR